MWPLCAPYGSVRLSAYGTVFVPACCGKELEWLQLFLYVRYSYTYSQSNTLNKLATHFRPLKFSLTFITKVSGPLATISFMYFKLLMRTLH